MWRVTRGDGFEVFYRRWSRTYNTPEDPRWFESSENWPQDSSERVTAVRV